LAVHYPTPLECPRATELVIVVSMANYSKWDKIDVDDDEETYGDLIANGLAKMEKMEAGKAGAAAASSATAVTTANKTADKAKAMCVDGEKMPGALQDLLSLKSDASFAELKAKMMNLPDGAKQKFLSQMSQPGMMDALTRKAEAIKSEDPAAAAKLLVGMRVKLEGLKARPELNGAMGTVEKYVEDKGRCVVKLDAGGEKILLKPGNLTRS